MPKNTAKRAQVSFFQKLLFFRRDHANTQLYQHTPFFLPKIAKKTRLTPFSIIYFFGSLLLLLTPKTLLNRLFRKNIPEKFYFLFFWDICAPYRSSCSIKIITYLFLRNSDLNCPKVVPKFLFLLITFFPPLSHEHTNPPTHNPFFPPKMPEKHASHLIL